MKIIKLTWRPVDYTHARYAKEPDAADLSFDKQLAWYFSDFWGSADAWGYYLRQLGYDARDIIYGIDELDTAWLRENGATLTKGEGNSILKSQLASLDPDILIIEGIERYGLGELDRFRQWLPNLQLLIGTSGVRSYVPEHIAKLDLFFSCIPDLIEDLRGEGMNAHHLPHAFDPRIIEHISSDPDGAIAFSFLGSILPGSNIHDYRRNVLETLTENTPLQLYSPSNHSRFAAVKKYIVNAGGRLVGKALQKANISFAQIPSGRKLSNAANWPELPQFEYSRKLARRTSPPVFGLDMYRKLKASRIAINVQPGISNNQATNIRMFETTGVGTCLLTDAASDLGNYFEADSEVVTFGSAEEAVEKAQYLIDHPAESMRIAQNGQQKTLKNHSYGERMKIVDMAINQALS